jgi:murein DD-endopeptidase MepM/ murein hydrolase activator NlpD
LESSLSPEEAALRYTVDGKGRFESGPRSSYPFLKPLGDFIPELDAPYGISEASPCGAGEFHPGLDFLAPAGTPVLATADGKVTKTGYTAGYGIHIAIDHGSFTSLYAHLAPKPAVKRGDRVSAGQIIGTVGDTGRCSRPVLHYEIQLSKSSQGKRYSVDPGIFLSLGTRAGSRGSAATLSFGFVQLLPAFKREKDGLRLSFDLDGTQTVIKAREQTLPFLHPLDRPGATIDTGFGIRNSPFTGKKEFHAGIDIVTPYGSQVYSPAEGTVAKVGYHSGYGNYLILRHGDLVTLFAHLDGKPLVKVGQTLQAGQVLGHTGKSGKSTGPHLHYEIRYVPDRTSTFTEEIKYLFDPEIFLKE